VTSFALHLLALTAALLLDRLVGDPPAIWGKIPHPVALVGTAIGWLDSRLNDSRQSFAERRRRGVFAALAIIAAAAGLGFAIHSLTASLPGGEVAEAVLVAVLLAQKSLVEHVGAVARALSSGELSDGRQAVSLIVGRDVSVLDESSISRAAMESAAENFSDGVVAPALWYALLGLPGLFVYKAVNTADSMIGYRSPRHEAFGWATARSDDALNLIPARLSALLIVGAAAPGGRLRAALAALRDAPRHRSPNAGWPEAALAGALGIALGGPRRYGDMAVDGAWLNAGGRRHVNERDIRAAIRVVETAWGLLAGLIVVAALIAYAFSL
jgi:adenosylcobinamide-phosphate synthase